MDNLAKTRTKTVIEATLKKILRNRTRSMSKMASEAVGSRLAMQKMVKTPLKITLELQLLCPAAVQQMLLRAKLR